MLCNQHDNFTNKSNRCNLVLCNQLRKMPIIVTHNITKKLIFEVPDMSIIFSHTNSLLLTKLLLCENKNERLTRKTEHPVH